MYTYQKRSDMLLSHGLHLLVNRKQATVDKAITPLKH